MQPVKTRMAAKSDQSSLYTKWVAKDPSFLQADSEDWSDLAAAQADLSCRWFVGLVMMRLILIFRIMWILSFLVVFISASFIFASQIYLKHT